MKCTYKKTKLLLSVKKQKSVETVAYQTVAVYSGFYVTCVVGKTKE